MKKWNIVGMAAAVGIAAITFHAYAADKLKVGFIYVCLLYTSPSPRD